MKAEQLRHKPFSRRSFIRSTSQVAAAWGLGQLLPGVSFSLPAQTIKGKERLIVRSLRPEDLETPVALLNTWITPNDLFYVRNHLYRPQINLKDWTLKVDGEVARPLMLTLDELQRMPRATVTVTLECAGNGRAFFDPPVAGIQWEKGAVGTARWTGVRLADVLQKAGMKRTAKYVVLDGADRPVGQVPDFIRNLPIEKALHPDTVLAYEMNGEPLPALHGFPLRAIVPGWEGAYSVKWLAQIQVTDREHEGFFVKTAYRYPTKRIAPGATVDPKDMAPLTGLVVKSLINSPLDGTAVRGRRILITGFAWAGETDIARVDISTDNGSSWHPAHLGKDHERYAWRSFEYEWRVTEPGSYLIMSRATDEKGRVQPMVSQWNPSGYLWNAIDQVRIDIEA